MNVEENRLRTYSDWPTNAVIDATRVARAGFYYTGRALEVQCFLCGTTISDWSYGDQAMTRHRLAEPSCPFVQNPSNTCNVPLVPFCASAPEPPSSNSGEEDPVLSSPTAENTESEGDYRTLAQRLTSFANWPISNIVSPERLAKSGFYYLQRGDLVKCVFCKGLILKWHPGDDPDAAHRMHFPKCTFYMQRECEPDMVEMGVVKLMPGTSTGLKELGIQAHTAPHKPKYATYEGRLRTFQDWPQNMKQTPEMLAMAGFYYNGAGDRVRCFHCDGGLQTWDANDDVWVEHARWFPKCEFLNLVRGQDFIKQCIDNRPQLDLSTITGTPEEESRDAAESPVASQPAVVSSTQEVTDTILEELLSTPPAMAALEIGLHVGRIKRALKRKMEQTGIPYTTADDLIAAVLDEQTMEDDSRLDNQTPDSPSGELINLLNQVITSQSMSNSQIGQVNNPQSDQVRAEEEDTAETRKQAQESDTAVNETDMLLRTAKTTSNEKTSLEEENRRLKEARLCKICMDQEVAVVFLPCGHLATCVLCAPSLTYCPMCRQEIRGTSIQRPCAKFLPQMPL